MWFEYLDLSQEDALLFFAEEYDYQLQFYTEQAIGNKMKAFTQKKGENVFQHRNFKTFQFLKCFADKYLMKYDDFWMIAFDVLRSRGSIKFYGVTSFRPDYILNEVVELEKKQYERRLKLSSSGKLNSIFYDSNNETFVLYYLYVFKQVKEKFHINYQEVLFDLIKTKKFSLDFLREFYSLEYDSFMRRFQRRLENAV